MKPWIAEHFDLIVWIWMALALGVFILLQFVTAPFGRHSKTTWGPMIKNKFGWFLMELPSFAIILTSLLIGSQVNSITWIIGGLWLLHYLNRTFIFPFRIKSGNKLMPLSIVVFAVFFNLINAGLNGYYLAEMSSYPQLWLASWQFMIGVPLFLLGFGINFWADEKLINLRKPGETGYVIPRGGLFNYVSAPNLSGEILEWTGFAILCWSLPAVSFAMWTVANLVPRAKAHHQFYLDKFPDYPKKRKRVIPFIY